jgi:hypothetical protein
MIKNEKDIGFETKKGLKFFLQKRLEKISQSFYLSFLLFFLALYFWCLENICSPSICASNDIRIFQFGYIIVLSYHILYLMQKNIVIYLHNKKPII